MITVAGVAGAFIIFYFKEKSDRRRKTLQAYEKQLYDKDLRTAVSTISTALGNGTHESDSEPRSVGSHRDQTSSLLNYLEFCCAGANRGLYERALFRELMEPLAQMLIENFLVEPRSGTLRSGRFLAYRKPLDNMAAIFSDIFEKAARRDSTYRPRTGEVTAAAPP